MPGAHHKEKKQYTSTTEWVCSACFHGCNLRASLKTGKARRHIQKSQPDQQNKNQPPPGTFSDYIYIQSMDSSEKKQFNAMVDNWLKGKATDQETKVIHNYFDLFSAMPDFFEEANRAEILKKRDELKAKIDRKIRFRQTIRLASQLTIGCAATLLICLFIGVLNKFPVSSKKYGIADQDKTADIGPGGNHAVLTLANGRKINLTDQSRHNMDPGNTEVFTTDKNGLLIYKRNKNNLPGIAFNTLETPKGGQYQVQLSDGSTVWLNAASSLKYPISFARNKRVVELRGEAYFEVAKDNRRPFIVLTGKQAAEVLGTSFNINAYQDEAAIKTTLLEGRVKIWNVDSVGGKVIKTGEQAVFNTKVTGRLIAINQVDVNEAVAWKNGYFMFDEEPLESILQKVSRWYNVDVEYLGKYPSKDLTFSGTISRYGNVSTVLKKLESTKSVSFRIDQRKVLVRVID